MLLYISLSGIFLSLVLMYFNARNYTSSIYLGFYFIFVCLWGLIQYIVLSTESVFWVSIFTTNLTFPTYTIGPLSYIYIRSVLTDNARLKKKDFWHLIPMIVFLISALPYLLKSFEFKVEIAKAIIADASFLGSYHFTLLADLFGVSAVYLSRPLLALGYTIASGLLLYNHSKYQRNSSNPLSKDFIYKWLITFLSFQVLLFVSYIFYLFEIFNIVGAVYYISENIIDIITSVSLIGLIISPIFYPRILYGIPVIPNTEFAQKPEISLEKTIPNKGQIFDENYMILIQEKLDENINGKRLFVHKNLNLARLSVIVDIPTHHLAYFFTVFKKSTFTDYKNFLRVNYAKKLILEKENDSITLEAIALMAGFSNRNSFTKTFTKIEGITPKLFISNNFKKTPQTISI